MTNPDTALTSSGWVATCAIPQARVRSAETSTPNPELLNDLRSIEEGGSSRVKRVFATSGESQPSLDGRASSKRALNVQGTADARHPLAHRLQSEVAWEGAESIEAAAVICYPQNHL